jgi:hypothetical protein
MTVVSPQSHSPQLHLIFYTKSGCHLCDGLAEKLNQIQAPSLAIELRDITTREDWFQAYQYEVPVLYTLQAGEPVLIPRPSPRATVAQLQQLLQRYVLPNQGLG